MNGENDMYHPLKLSERKLRVNKIIKSACNKCGKTMMAGFKDPCWVCPWRWLMNQIMGSDMENDKKET